ncbi:MAG: heme o synthase [Acidobacteriota bacterium]
MSQPAAAARPHAMGYRLSDFHELTKPRLTSLVIITAAVGFWVASPARVDWLRGLMMVLGMLGVVGGGNALNEYWERDIDARMERTRNRPLPAGRLAPAAALAFGTLISLAGLALLYTTVNLPATLVAFAGWASYVFIYTPLKQRTAASTLIGAFPGAVPPLVGWAAARGTLEPAAWALFAIIFVWQIPHFFAIARHFREDYARGGFPLLGIHDAKGATTARLSAAYALLLVPIGALPAVLDVAGTLYLIGSLLLGGAFFAITLWALKALGAGRERWVFLASLVYLTVLMAILVVDRLPVG